MSSRAKIKALELISAILNDKPYIKDVEGKWWGRKKEVKNG